MYKIKQNTIGQDVVIRDNGNGSITSFFADPSNTDYQQYLKWLAEGNTPEPAEEQQ